MPYLHAPLLSGSEAMFLMIFLSEHYKQAQQSHIPIYIIHMSYDSQN